MSHSPTVLNDTCCVYQVLGLEMYVTPTIDSVEGKVYIHVQLFVSRSVGKGFFSSSPMIGCFGAFPKRVELFFSCYFKFSFSADIPLLFDKMTQSSIVADALALLAFARFRGGNSNIQSEEGSDSPPRPRQPHLFPPAPTTKPKCHHQSQNLSCEMNERTSIITAGEKKGTLEVEGGADANADTMARASVSPSVHHPVARVAVAATTHGHQQQNDVSAQTTEAVRHLQNLQRQQAVLHAIQQQQLYTSAATAGAMNTFQTQPPASMVDISLAGEYNTLSSCNPYNLAVQYAVAAVTVASHTQSVYSQSDSAQNKFLPAAAGKETTTAATTAAVAADSSMTTVSSIGVQEKLQQPQTAAGHRQLARPSSTLLAADAFAGVLTFNTDFAQSYAETAYAIDATTAATTAAATAAAAIAATTNKAALPATLQSYGNRASASSTKRARVDDLNDVINSDEINNATNINTVRNAKRYKASVTAESTLVSPMPAAADITEKEKEEMAHVRKLTRVSLAALQRTNPVDNWASHRDSPEVDIDLNDGGIVVQVGLSSGIKHTGTESTLAAHALQTSIKPGSKAAEIIEFNERKSGEAKGRHLVLNAGSSGDPECAILSINDVYQDWVLALHTKARNLVAVQNGITGEPKRQLVKQSRRYKHNIAQVTYSRKVSTAKKEQKQLAFDEQIRLRNVAAGVLINRHSALIANQSIGVVPVLVQPVPVPLLSAVTANILGSIAS